MVGGTAATRRTEKSACSLTGSRVPHSQMPPFGAGRMSPARGASAAARRATSSGSGGTRRSSSVGGCGAATSLRAAGFCHGLGGAYEGACERLVAAWCPWGASARRRRQHEGQRQKADIEPSASRARNRRQPHHGLAGVARPSSPAGARALQSTQTSRIGDVPAANGLSTERLRRANHRRLLAAGRRPPRT
jgi:hypothetical protein